jgi:hypothetical protein
MVVDPVSALAVSVLLLVIKLRSVHVGPDGIDVQLDPVRSGAFEFIASFFQR